MSPKLFAANANGRLISLDVFRGITIAGMTLVNNPGTWSSIYWPLEHAEWHGWTPTDLVFPFFLFIVGVSITLAFARRVEEGTVQRDLYLKVIKRSAIIFGLGLFLNGFPYFQLSTIRIAGRAPTHRDLLPGRVADLSDDKSQNSTPDCARVAHRLLPRDDARRGAGIRRRAISARKEASRPLSIA